MNTCSNENQHVLKREFNNNTNKHTNNNNLKDSQVRNASVENSVENPFHPTARQLQGIPYDLAECYGKPHVNAEYLRDDVDSYTHFGSCFICGNPSTNAHHVPPKSVSRVFTLMTKRGIFVLKPALFSLCGSGTTGCHSLFHAKKLIAKWIWRDEISKKNWWDGELLKDIKPHDPVLFAFGFWQIRDEKDRVVAVFGR